ncbi:hypothetical protein B0H10DRAFT_1946237 [Mycena sp. CBHHK59/15]|nr:hypothetical protein B0H10DRAFT_1946237 [Mycena sp. CBHHK59/15]
MGADPRSSAQSSTQRPGMPRGTQFGAAAGEAVAVVLLYAVSPGKAVEAAACAGSRMRSQQEEWGRVPASGVARVGTAHRRRWAELRRGAGIGERAPVGCPSYAERGKKGQASSRRAQDLQALGVVNSKSLKAITSENLVHGLV